MFAGVHAAADPHQVEPKPALKTLPRGQEPRQSCLSAAPATQLHPNRTGAELGLLPSLLVAATTGNLAGLLCLQGSPDQAVPGGRFTPFRRSPSG